VFHSSLQCDFFLFLNQYCSLVSIKFRFKLLQRKYNILIGIQRHLRHSIHKGRAVEGRVSLSVILRFVISPLFVTVNEYRRIMNVEGSRY